MRPRFSGAGRRDLVSAISERQLIHSKGRQCQWYDLQKPECNYDLAGQLDQWCCHWRTKGQGTVDDLTSADHQYIPRASLPPLPAPIRNYSRRHRQKGAALQAGPGAAAIHALGHFDAILSAILDEGYQRADQVYRNASKVCAMLVSLALALGTLPLMGLSSGRGEY